MVFRAVRQAVAEGDPARIAALRQAIGEQIPPRERAFLLTEDAFAARPMRARVHLCRMHLGPECQEPCRSGAPPASLSGA